MSSQTTYQINFCTACGRKFVLDDAYCADCGADRWFAGQIGLRHRTESTDPTSPNAFSLGSLMLLMTLACICAGLVAAAPLLLGPVVFLVTPALIRTVVACRYQRQDFGSLTMADKISQFLLSLGIVGVAWMATGFLLVICLIPIVVQSDVFGFLLVLAVFGYMNYLLRPRRLFLQQYYAAREAQENRTSGTCDQCDGPLKTDDNYCSNCGSVRPAAN